MTAFFQTLPGALILLVVGFVFLIKGADFFVEGASAVAKKLHVPALVIGMTIVEWEHRYQSYLFQLQRQLQEAISLP